MGARDLEAETAAAKFAGWFDAQDYDPYTEFGEADMADAFRAGMEAAQDHGGSSGPRGNSYANGASVNNGACSPWSWRGGYQAPRPVTYWDFTEGRLF